MARDETWDEEQIPGLERELELELEHSDEEFDDAPFYEASSEPSSDVYEFGNESDSVDRELLGDFSRPEFDDRDDYGKRLYELSLREYESDLEIDRELAQVFDDMEREYFLGAIGRGLKKGLGGLAKAAKSAGGDLVKNAAKYAGQTLKGGGLMPLAKAALSTVASSTPWGAAVMPALSALGFSPGGGGGNQGDPWQAFAAIAQDAFRKLAANINQATASELSDPIRTGRLASGALEAALRTSSAGRPRGATRSGTTRRIRIRRGERLIIEAE